MTFRKYCLYVMLLKYDMNTYLWNMIWIHTCEIWYKHTSVVNHIGGVMVSVFASRAVDIGSSSGQIKPKTYKFGICWFSAKYTVKRRKKQRLVGSESG